MYYGFVLSDMLRLGYGAFFTEKATCLFSYGNFVNKEFKGLKHDATISSAKKGKGNPGSGGVAENYKEGKIPDPCVVQKQ